MRRFIEENGHAPGLSLNLFTWLLLVEQKRKEFGEPDVQGVVLGFQDRSHSGSIRASSANTAAT